MRWKKRGGMTLVEVMVVVVIMALVLGGALFSSRVVRGSRPELEAASQVKGLLQRARSQAMAEGVYARLIRSGHVMLLETFNADSNRWIFRDRAELSRLGTGCPAPPPGLRPVDTVVVNLTGALTPTGGMVFCDPSRRFAAAVEITAGGAVRTWKFVNGWRISEHEK